MGNTYSSCPPEIADFIADQHMFFVATAPMGSDAHINLSPKGLDTLRVLDEQHVAYLDITGSGAETIAHLRENGRITLMFCAFKGDPLTVRIYGKGRASLPNDPEFNDLIEKFPPQPGTRSIIIVEISRVSTSCGFGTPQYTFATEREELPTAMKFTDVPAYQAKMNRESIDGLPALP